MAAALRQAALAATQAGATRIERLAFAVRRGGHVTPETVTLLFAALSPGTPAEGAALAIEWVGSEQTPDELTLVSIDVPDPPA
jgi:Zn finger protein HypA/HybF involved in hydrogenase expression